MDLFEKSISDFEKIEKRGSFYDMALNLMSKGFEIEAYILILATWNSANFRYAVNNFDVLGFKDTIEKLNPIFSILKDEKFQTIDFNKYKKEISIIFVTLSSIDGIKYTGASKIMHLKNRDVFVMWDGYINGNKATKHHEKLEIIKKGIMTIKNYPLSPEGYIEFLIDKKNLYKNKKLHNYKYTLTKAIDEFNYMNITIPLLKIVKEEEKKKNEMKRDKK